jgi:hypothetical protein
LGFDPVRVPAIHERLGQIYEARGDDERAVLHCRAFIELLKNADAKLQARVADARRRLERLTLVGRRPDLLFQSENSMGCDQSSFHPEVSVQRVTGIGASSSGSDRRVARLTIAPRHMLDEGEAALSAGPSAAGRAGMTWSVS